MQKQSATIVSGVSNKRYTATAAAHGSDVSSSASTVAASNAVATLPTDTSSATVIAEPTTSCAVFGSGKDQEDTKEVVALSRAARTFFL